MCVIGNAGIMHVQFVYSVNSYISCVCPPGKLVWYHKNSVTLMPTIYSNNLLVIRERGALPSLKWFCCPELGLNDEFALS